MLSRTMNRYLIFVATGVLLTRDKKQEQTILTPAVYLCAGNRKMCGPPYLKTTQLVRLNELFSTGHC